MKTIRFILKEYTKKRIRKVMKLRNRWSINAFKVLWKKSSLESWKHPNKNRQVGMPCSEGGTTSDFNSVI